VPAFALTGHADAAVEEVWKLLFDPSRFPEGWVGVETVRADSSDSYVLWPTGYPDFPMPQQLRTDRAAARVTISCQVSDIDVRVELPEAEAHRVSTQRAAIGRSLRRLAELAAAG
jgi:hypothetical protein